MHYKTLGTEHPEKLRPQRDPRDMAGGSIARTQHTHCKGLSPLSPQQSVRARKPL